MVARVSSKRRRRYVRFADDGHRLPPNPEELHQLQGKARGVLNGAFYTIRSVRDTTVLVLCELTKKELELPMELEQVQD